MTEQFDDIQSESNAEPSILDFMTRGTQGGSEAAPNEQAETSTEATAEAEPSVAEEKAPEQPEEASSDRLALDAARDELADARFEVAQYDAALDLMRRDNARLTHLLRQANILDERDLKIREYELQEAAQRRLHELEQERSRTIETSKETLKIDEMRVRYEREIPKALAQFSLVTQAELIQAIQNLPPNATENIPALAKQIHEDKLARARKILGAGQQKRVAPNAVKSRPVPFNHELNVNGFAQLLMKNSGL